MESAEWGGPLLGAPTWAPTFAEAQRAPRRCAGCQHKASDHFLPEGNHEVRRHCEVDGCHCPLFISPEWVRVNH